MLKMFWYWKFDKSCVRKLCTPTEKVIIHSLTASLLRRSASLIRSLFILSICLACSCSLFCLACSKASSSSFSLMYITAHYFCYKQSIKTTQLKKDLQRPSLPTSWVLVPQPTRCTITLYLEQLKSLFGIWKINNSKLRCMKEFS